MLDDERYPSKQSERQEKISGGLYFRETKDNIINYYKNSTKEKSRITKKKMVNDKYFLKIEYKLSL